LRQSESPARLSALEEFASRLEGDLRDFAQAWLEALRGEPSSAWRRLAEAAKSLCSSNAHIATSLELLSRYLAAENLEAFVQLGRRRMPNPPDALLKTCLAGLRNTSRAMEAFAKGSLSQQELAKGRAHLQSLRNLKAEIGPPERRAIGCLLERLEKWLEKPASCWPLECRLISRRAIARPVITAAWQITNHADHPIENIVLHISEPADSITGNLAYLEGGESAPIEASIPAQGNRLRFSGELTWNGGAQPLAGEIEILRPRRPKEISNPYLPGKPLGPESPMFFGRQRDLEALVRALLSEESGRVVILTGQRRSGKTSLLKRFAARHSHLFQCVYVDVQGLLVDSVPHFFYELSRRTTDTLEQAGMVMDRPDPSEPRVMEGYYLEQAARIGRRPLLLILDEFDDLETKVRSGLLPEAVFGHLRHLFQHTSVSFLLSGTHRLEELGRDYWSFLFNLGLYHQIGPLEKEEAAALVFEPMERAGLVCEDLAAEELFALSGGHPYLLQLTCHHVVEECITDKTGGAGRKQVQSSVRRLLDGGEAHLRYLWELAGEENQEALRRLCQAPLRPASDGERAALQRLAAKHLARPCSSGRYVLNIGLLGEWMKQSGCRT
jgi:hypothetical protein